MGLGQEATAVLVRSHRHLPAGGQTLCRSRHDVTWACRPAGVLVICTQSESARARSVERVHAAFGATLSNVDYALISELPGRSCMIATEAVDGGLRPCLRYV